MICQLQFGPTELKSGTKMEKCTEKTMNQLKSGQMELENGFKIIFSIGMAMNQL
jgi:hypothetical protein